MGPWKCVHICLCMCYPISKPTNSVVSSSSFFILVGWTGDRIRRPQIQCCCFRRRLSDCLLRRAPSSVRVRYKFPSFPFGMFCTVCADFGSWDIVYGCKMRIEPNRKITVCMCVFVPLFLCVFVFSGSLTTGPDVEFSPSGSVVFACSPFLSNHSFASAVNKRVGKSICTHACTYLGLCSQLDAAFLKPPTLIWSKGKRKHRTRIRAHRILALLLTHDWAKTHTPTDRNHREEPQLPPFSCLLI